MERFAPPRGRTVPICGDSAPLMMEWLGFCRHANFPPWQSKQAWVAMKRQGASSSICLALRRNFSAATHATAPNIVRLPSCQLDKRHRRGR